MSTCKSTQKVDLENKTSLFAHEIKSSPDSSSPPLQSCGYVIYYAPFICTMQKTRKDKERKLL
jgi:hypothetical protein